VRAWLVCNYLLGWSSADLLAVFIGLYVYTTTSVLPGGLPLFLGARCGGTDCTCPGPALSRRYITLYTLIWGKYRQWVLSLLRHAGLVVLGSAYVQSGSLGSIVFCVARGRGARCIRVIRGVYLGREEDAHMEVEAVIRGRGGVSLAIYLGQFFPSRQERCCTDQWRMRCAPKHPLFPGPSRHCRGAEDDEW
jgi:hypothetical protein